MSNILGIRLKPEVLRSIAFGGISGAYANVGTPLTEPAVILHLQNDTNADLLISFSGGVDHEFIKAGGFILFDAAANKSHLSETRVFSAQTQVQAKQASGAPSSGSLYLATFYGSAD